MIFDNPFSRKEDPTPEPAMSETDSNMINNVLHPQASDEQSFVEQKDRLAELTRWQQDLSPAYQELLWDLYGVAPDDQGTLVKIPDYIAPCNIVGAINMVNLLKRVDRNTMLGAWNETAMFYSIIKKGQVILFDMIQSYKDYGIQKNKLHYVFHMVHGTMESTYRRGLENGERRWLGTIQKSAEIKHIQPEKESQGLFGKK